MDEAVENGVGVGGVSDQAVPVGDGDLAGDEGRFSPVAVLEDPESARNPLFANPVSNYIYIAPPDIYTVFYFDFKINISDAPFFIFVLQIFELSLFVSK